jgi:hypothetical protein
MNGLQRHQSFVIAWIPKEEHWSRNRKRTRGGTKHQRKMCWYLLAFQQCLPLGATNPGRQGSYDVYYRAPSANLKEESRLFMFLILAVVLVLLWLGGFFVLHVSGFLIHLLLIFALISIIMNFVGGRRAV